MKVNNIYHGHTLDVLKTFPPESIDMSVSSPPYWGVRNYGVGEQEFKDGKYILGLEPTFDLFISHLCDIYDEVYRVLKPYGTCFVNIYDTYWGGGQAQGHTKDTKNMGKTTLDHGSVTKPVARGSNYKSKCMCAIPQRFVIEMINRGWILRNDIIWVKPNGIPESVVDRFTKTHEYVFFFTKNEDYYFEQQLEDYKEATLNRAKYNWCNSDNKASQYQSKNGLNRNEHYVINEFGKNKRDVWTVPVANCNESHFAVFPEELIDPIIKAGCPKEVCVQCGKPKLKKYIRVGESSSDVAQTYSKSGKKQDLRAKKKEVFFREIVIEYDKCECQSEFQKGIVLDPFMGSGTTAVVAEQNKVNWIGIELNPEYIEIANKRIQNQRNNYKPRITQIREGRKNHNPITNYFGDKK